MDHTKTAPTEAIHVKNRNHYVALADSPRIPGLHLEVLPIAKRNCMPTRSCLMSTLALPTKRAPHIGFELLDRQALHHFADRTFAAPIP